jgi:hypothetical protein
MTSQRQGGRRVVVAIAALIVAVVILAISLVHLRTTDRSSAASSDHTTSVGSLADDQLSFRYPSAWRLSTPPGINRMGGPGGGVLGYLSPLVLSDPCQTIADGYACGLPIDHLPPGGLLVVVGSETGVNPPEDAQRLAVDGGTAALIVTRPGDCGQIGGAVGYQLWVPIPAPAGTATTIEPNSYFTFLACAADPVPEELDRQVRDLLASVVVHA